MSAYVYLTASRTITSQPCKLLSIIIVTDGGGPGKVDVYDAHNVDANHKVAPLRCPANQSVQYGWSGLELSRGLYIDIVEKADYVTVEWEPCGGGSS